MNLATFYYVGCCQYRGSSEMKYSVSGAKSLKLVELFKCFTGLVPKCSASQVQDCTRLATEQVYYLRKAIHM